MTARREGPLPIAAFLLLPFLLFAGFLFLADQFLPVELQHKWWWAGFMLYDFPVPYRIVAALLPLVPLLVSDSVFDNSLKTIRQAGERLRQLFQHPAVVVPAIGVLLWIFRDASLVIGDAQFYTIKLIPEQAFSERGSFLSYDSIGTTFLYSRGYRFASLYFALPPLTWYQIFGLIFLGGFITWAWLNRKKQRLLGTLLPLTLLFCGNWSQSTFGAAEHYGQVFLCALAFAILGVETLRGREPLWKPCLAFAIGAFFHLLIAWFLPALLYLIVSQWKKEEREGRHLAIAAILIPAFMTGLLAYSYGYDLSFLTQGNARGINLIPFLDPSNPYMEAELFHYTTFELRHLAHILQEVLLMGWPGVILLVAGAASWKWSVLLHDRAARFLAALLAGALLMNLLWNPELEMWRDQDLFSISGLAITLFGAYIALGPAGEHLSTNTQHRLIAAAILGGLAWRIPILIWHSFLSPAYYAPEATIVTLPFGIGVGL